MEANLPIDVERGRRLRSARMGNNLRLEQVAHAAGVTVLTASRWELGQHAIPERALLSLQARLGLNPAHIILGSAPTWLQGAESQPQPRPAVAPAADLQVVDLSCSRPRGATSVLRGRTLVVVCRTMAWAAGDLFLGKMAQGMCLGHLRTDRDGGLFLHPPDNDSPGSPERLAPVRVREQDLLGKVVGLVERVPEAPGRA